MVFGAGLLSFGLWGGKAWWNAVEREYRDELYRPFEASARIEHRAGGRTLEFKITDSIWTSLTYASHLVVAVLRGCDVYLIAPSFENAPSAAPVTTGGRCSRSAKLIPLPWRTPNRH